MAKKKKVKLYEEWYEFTEWKPKNKKDERDK